MPALPAETMAANGTDFVSWRHCDVHTRSTFNILSLCLSTLVICVWNAFHPDVPDPRMLRWKVYRMRLYGFLVGLFLPEVLVLNALDQFLDAREFLQKMNGIQPESRFTMSYWTKLMKEMYPRALTMSYWTEDWRPNVATESDLPQWTMTRAFYVVMGGFFAKAKSSDRVTYLDPDEVISLCKVDRMRPLFAVDGLEDHSKAGALAKALFCWQLLVFVISCIARRAEHLPLSLLEITTLAHSLCGLAAFVLWWHKPHSVNEVVSVPIDDSLRRKIAWTKYNDDEEPSTIVGLAILVDPKRESLAKAVLSSLAVPALYGLPHLLGLGTEFPTLAERRCWQVATAIIIGTPVFGVALGWVDARASSGGKLEITVRGLAYGGCVVYCIASCFIIAECFRQLFALPSGAFVAPAFVCYLPHFS